MALAQISSDYRAKIIAATYKKWIKPHATVLDVGCGNGVVSWRLKKMFSLKMTGCDVIDYMQYDIPFVKMTSGTKLPFSKKQFDIVMFNDVLHHTEKPHQIALVKEALRVGKNVVIFEVQPTFLGMAFDFLLNKIHNPRMYIPFTFRETRNWKEIFKKIPCTYTTKMVKTPVWYPFSHVAFLLH